MRSASIRRRISGTSGASIRWFVAPTARYGIMNTCISAEWYSGIACSGSSCSVIPRAWIPETYSCTRPRWVIIAPLGRDVVPQV